MARMDASWAETCDSMREHLPEYDEQSARYGFRRAWEKRDELEACAAPARTTGGAKMEPSEHPALAQQIRDRCPLLVAAQPPGFHCAPECISQQAQPCEARECDCGVPAGSDEPHTIDCNSQQAQPLTDEMIDDKADTLPIACTRLDFAEGAKWARERMVQPADARIAWLVADNKRLTELLAQPAVTREQIIKTLGATCMKSWEEQAQAVRALFAPKADDAAEDRAYFEATGGVPFDHWGNGCPNDCDIPQHQEHKA